MQKTPRWRQRMIAAFSHETRLGRRVEIFIICCIILGVLVAVLGSVVEIQEKYTTILYNIEWGFTIIFTLEYILRLLVAQRPLRYVFSFFGVIDLLAILPAYLALFFPVAHYAIILRVLRALRIFRVLKLLRYSQASQQLLLSIYNSRTKVFVFLYCVLLAAVVFGTAIYLIEGPAHGFTSIPRSIYWVIVTMSTVGYGDISPQTVLGQILTTIIILCGYGIIAVPTGIVTSQLVAQKTLQNESASGAQCQDCGEPLASSRAKFCSNCGQPLTQSSSTQTPQPQGRLGQRFHRKP